MKLYNIDNYTEITKNCIDNVKCTRIICGIGSDKYNKFLQYIAKKVLKLSAIREDGHRNDEVGILVRLSDKYESRPIYGCWNDDMKTSVIDTVHNVEYNYLIDESDDMSLVFVHNHPNNSKTSLNDILSVLSNDALAAVIAVGNNGTVHYMTKNSNDNLYYRRLSKTIQRKIREAEITYEYTYQNLIKNQNKFRIYIK